MSFDNDELPPAISSSAGSWPCLQADRVRLVAYRNNKAPLEENRQQVLLEIIDKSPAVERSGLDLVAVLDVSGSMGEGNKLTQMKTAMKFVIAKLDPIDRLSIVTFSNTADVQRQLLCVTKDSKTELEDMVENRLKANGNTNMEDGLKTGLKVLAGRRYSVGRVGSIILMSDGRQNLDSEAESVNIGNVAVYTFGFGADSDAEVMNTIANKSRGGTFYYVRDGQRLSEHFSQILAGLQSIVVRDLKLTVWQHQGHSKIRKVDAGAYHDPRTPVDGESSVTISFGDLYRGEVRKVIVELTLPAIQRGYHATILFAQCRYSVKGNVFYSPRDYLGCSIRRTGTARLEEATNLEVKAELVRVHYTITLWEASQLNDLDRAKRKLEEAKKDLDDADKSSSTRVISILRAELMLLLSVATWRDLLACLLASWTSHRLQRFAAWGGDLSVSIFVTPLMVEYKVQAKKYVQDPDRTTVIDQGICVPPRGEESSWWAWRAVIILCTVLAIALIVAGAAVFAVYLLYKPKTPYLVVSDARLVQLQYGQDGTIQYLQASITILAENNNSKVDASFSRVDLALGFHGADVALLRAEPFVVARQRWLPLRYNVVSSGQALDPAGMQAMDEALKVGVVPLDLFGKARTRWKVGVFVKHKFWTRISCRLRFFFPGNGTVMPTDRQRCRSKSP